LATEKRLHAPIIPKIKSPEDLSNFDDYPDDDQIPVYHDNGTLVEPIAPSQTMSFTLVVLSSVGTDWDAEF